ncbi:MAG: GatB/YqeY domain-containing protein [Patescibacteria group bacterium]
MPLKQQIEAEFISALKAKNAQLVSTLRMLKSAITNKEKQTGEEIDDTQILKTIEQEVKKRQESFNLYQKAGRAESAQKEQNEINILKAYLPEEMPTAKLEKIIDKTITKLGAKEIKDMGKVMGTVIAEVAGRASGDKISQLVKRKLTV